MIMDAEEWASELFGDSELGDIRRQLLLPVGDNYLCRLKKFVIHHSERLDSFL